MNTPMTRIREEKPIYFSAEKLAYWFFRLNGCFLLENFLVHHENRKKGNGTEVDLLAMRFPNRRELKLIGAPMPDDPIFKNDKIEVFFAEVKSNQMCSINKSWLDPDYKNMERILYIVGAIPENEVTAAAQKLYKDHIYENSLCRIRLFAIGAERNHDLSNGITQLIWQDILLFIFKRLFTYWDYKVEHDKWDDVGKRLFEMMKSNEHTPDNFVENISKNLI